MYLRLVPIFLFALLTQNVFSETTPVSEEEVETYFEAYQEQATEEQLLASELFQKCKEAGDKQATFDCMNGVFTNASDENLTKISEQFGYKSLDKNAATSSKDILEYLQERLREGIFGKETDAKKKIEDRTFVNHDAFYQMYKEQIGKNTLLTISNYCLSNWYVKDKYKFLYVKNKSTTDKAEYEFKLIDIFKTKPSANFYNNEGDSLFTIQDAISDESHDMAKVLSFAETYPQANRYTDMKEAEVCSLQTKAECDKRFTEGTPPKVKDYKSLALIEKLKDVEFLLSHENLFKTDLIKDRYTFCAQNIKNMCEIFKCNNIYDTSTPKKTLDSCTALGAPVTTVADASTSIDLTAKNDNGAIACNLMGRLEEYRTMINTTQTIQDDNQSFKVKKGFFTDRKIFNPDNIDSLTSVNSNDIGAEITGLEGFDGLEQNCTERDQDTGSLRFKEDAYDNEACKPLIAKTNKDKLDTMEIDTAGKTEAELRSLKLEDLKIGSQEYDDFKNKHNLTDEEMTDLDIIEPLLRQDFLTKKKALVAALNKKYILEKKLKADSSDQNDAVEVKKDIANKNLADIQQHRKRVQTLFEYSNIVSSYLEIDDADGENKRQNTTPRTVEVADAKEGDLKEYFKNNEEEGGASASGSVDYINAIGAILGVNESKDDAVEP